MAKTKMPCSCQRERRYRSEHGTISLDGGPFKKVSSEWVTRPCGAPLFGEDRAQGECRPCASGFVHLKNFPVTAKLRLVQGRWYIAAAPVKRPPPDWAFEQLDGAVVEHAGGDEPIYRVASRQPGVDTFQVGGLRFELAAGSES